VTARSVDGSYREQPDPTTFGGDLPQLPTRPSPVLAGAASGVAASLAMMFVYQLVRIGWLLVREVTRQPGTGATGLESPDRIFGVLLLGGLLSLAPTIVAGGVLGAVLGWFLAVTRQRQGPVRSWLSGSLLAFGTATLVNLVVLLRHRSEALAYAQWRSLLGIPSLLFVILFGGLGVYLHLRQSRPALP